MELSQLQKDLVCMFKAYEMTEDEVIGTMLLLKNLSHQRNMMVWIKTHTSATVDEVIQKAMSLQQSQK